MTTGGVLDLVILSLVIPIKLLLSSIVRELYSLSNLMIAESVFICITGTYVAKISSAKDLS